MHSRKSLQLCLFSLAIAVGAQFSSAALTYPGCADVTASDFKVVDLVGRNVAGSPNALVIDPTLLEPLSMYVHTDGRVYWTERTNTGNTAGGNGATGAVGRIRVFNPANNTVKTVQSFNVSTSALTQGAGNPEYGLRSFIMDPAFEANRYAYVMYNPRTTVTGRGVDTLLLSRFTMPTLDTLDLSSEKKLLKIPFTIGICCHEGGSLDFDAQGNLYVGIGNNTENVSSGSNPIHMDDTLLGTTGENKDRATRDNPARVANTMDYRGKILRIKPDTSTKGYSIPAGNYWQKYFEAGGAWVAGQDTAKILKEIYVVGSRSPWTLSIDKPTGWMVFGDVGPDNANAASGYGPVARDEWNLARGPGFFGFPYFVGFQQGYNMWNPATNSYGLPVQKPDSIYNNSPNNTGVTRLTKALPPLLAACHNTFSTTALAAACNGHPYDLAANSAGGTAAVSGPIYRYRNELVSAKKLPPHFDKKWIINDGVRHWVKLATLNDSGTAVTAVDDWPGYATLFRGSGAYGLSDFKIGPNDGALYVVGYNANNFASSNNTRISRIEYQGACAATVPVYRGPAERRAELMRGIFLAPGAGGIAWPEGMSRAELFDTRGRQVAAFARAGKESRIDVPRALGSGLLRVRFLP